MSETLSTQRRIVGLVSLASPDWLSMSEFSDTEATRVVSQRPSPFLACWQIFHLLTFRFNCFCICRGTHTSSWRSFLLCAVISKGPHIDSPSQLLCPARHHIATSSTQAASHRRSRSTRQVKWGIEAQTASVVLSEVFICFPGQSIMRQVITPGTTATPCRPLERPQRVAKRTALELTMFPSAN